MIRNPKAFEAWSICSCWVHSIITELEMLPNEGCPKESSSEPFTDQGEQKSPIYPLHLGGVWMVGVRGYIGLQNFRSLFQTGLVKRKISCPDELPFQPRISLLKKSFLFKSNTFFLVILWIRVI
jgi:hypothetical protein